MFDWCRTGDHENCHREYERWHIDPRTNKVVRSGEKVKCQCKTRKCKCYTAPVDRVKPKKRRRKS